MGKKIVDTFGAKSINIGVAREEVRRTVDPHDTALERLGRAFDKMFDRPSEGRDGEVRRLIMEAKADVRDAKAGRNGR